MALIMDSNIFEPPLGDPFSKAFSITSLPCAGSHRKRCCNCGLPLRGKYYLELDKAGDTKMYAACSEGCAINIWTRGYCATEGRHPWIVYPEDDESWVEQWPEVQDIRSRLLASENREQ